MIFAPFTNTVRRKISAALLAVGFLAVLGWSVTASAASVSPAASQPSALNPGLAVDYYYSELRHVDELVEYMGRKNPTPGEPLPNLDYVRGDNKPTLSSKFPRFVGAEITGFINFPEAGTYNLVVVSNDGVRLWIDGTLIYEDPDVHADRESDLIPLNVEAAGWHDIRLLYFQRKNATALVLGWQHGDNDLEIVPPEFFGHVQ